MVIQWVRFAGDNAPRPPTAWGARVWAWVKGHWRALAAGLAGLGAAVFCVTKWRTRVRKAAAAVPPDPAPALVPLAAVEVALAAADTAARAAAAQDAQKAKAGHAAIDAASSVGDVDAVLYGFRDVGGGSGGSPP
jgi:hypothetical protein